MILLEELCRAAQKLDAAVVSAGEIRIADLPPEAQTAARKRLEAGARAGREFAEGTFRFASADHLSRIVVG